jgi:Arc/MetJ-type ribon-helix-helix transcriptional regulator
MQHKNLTFKVPVRVIEAIDRAARDASARTGFNVTRSDIIRRALELYLAARQAEADQPTTTERKSCN